MPRGKWDRSKTKAQRAAEKTNKKGPRFSALQPGAVKSLPGSTGPSTFESCGSGSSSSYISMKDKADVLMDYLTTLVSARKALGLDEAAKTTSFDKAIANTLERLEGLAEVLQPLPVKKVEVVMEKREGVAPVAPAAPAPAPVSAPIAAAPAPIAFNAPVPAPIAVPKT